MLGSCRGILSDSSPHVMSSMPGSGLYAGWRVPPLLTRTAGVLEVILGHRGRSVGVGGCWVRCGPRCPSYYTMALKGRFGVLFLCSFFSYAHEDVSADLVVVVLLAQKNKKI